MSNYSCVLCNSKELNLTRSVRDNCKKKIYTCSGCNMIQLHPRITTNPEKDQPSVDNQDANRKTAPIDLENNKKLYKGKLVGHPDILQLAHVLENDYDRFLDHVAKYITDTSAIKLLDVGTGYGHFPHLVKQDYPNINAYGLDCNYSKLKYGKETCKLNFNFIFDKIENENVVQSFENTFDIITSWHVLEHVYEPILWIKNIMQMLNDQGVALLEFPNEDDELLQNAPEYSNLIHFEDHVNYFNKETVSKLLNDCDISDSNFTISGVQRYGFYNYIDWVRYGTKDKVNGDDYRNINSAPRSKYEKFWIQEREKNLTCDTLLVTIKK
mgnify:CR=1 FL=1|jgi:2-polyprenyl-3-methyl-5-hydroxy-6-metoxy-1,4-benzoquinol methylase